MNHRGKGGPKEKQWGHFHVKEGVPRKAVRADLKAQKSTSIVSNFHRRGIERPSLSTEKKDIHTKGPAKDYKNAADKKRENSTQGVYFSRTGCRKGDLGSEKLPLGTAKGTLLFPPPGNGSELGNQELIIFFTRGGGRRQKRTSVGSEDEEKRNEGQKASRKR